MKEMEYTREQRFRILAHGVYKVAEYWIMSFGGHPCAYIDATDFPEDAFDRCPAHGGITYDEDHLYNVWDEAFEGFEKGKKRFVGWDYAHPGDYIMFPTSRAQDGHKWTTREIMEDVESVIDHALDSSK